MKFSEGKINPVKLEQGDWVDNIPEMGGFRVKVRGLNNTDWKKLERQLIDQIPRKKKIGGRIPQDVMEEITSECLYQTSLIDWDGLNDDDEKPIPYSKQIAHEMLFLPENMKFRNAVIWAATMVVEQDDADQEAITKN